MNHINKKNSFRIQHPKITHMISKLAENRKYLQKSTKFTKAVKSLGRLGIRLLVGSEEGINPEPTSLCPWEKCN